MLLVSTGRIVSTSFLCGSANGSVTVTSILRTTAVENSIRNRADITYNFIGRGIWTLTEANLGIVAACLLVLKRPLSRFFPRVFASTKKTSYAEENRQRGGYPLGEMQSHRKRSDAGGSNGSEQDILAGNRGS